MDCGACGKPISLTAKFCGKCGAPVKRAAPPQEQDTSTTSLLDAAQTPPAPDVEPIHVETQPVDDLVLTLDIPQASADHAAMLKIDLDLVIDTKPEGNSQEPHQHIPAAEPIKSLEPETKQASTLAATKPSEPVVFAETSQPDSHDMAAQANPINAQWLQDWQTANAQIQEKLEKHSQLLDVVVLNSQHDHQRASQPDANSTLLAELLERQIQLAKQLTGLEQQSHKPAEPAVVKMPEEFKLHLEKQKIELLKAFSQNIAQNTSNVESANQQTLERIEALMVENASATKTLEVHLAPISQSVADLKARMQAISKKVDEAAAKPAKYSQAKTDDSTEGSGGFIIFVIGLLCGLTVVLSSLAIYNFLSREPALPVKNSHEAGAPAEDGHDKNAHDAPAHDDPAHAAPAHDEPTHDAATSHDKPAADSKAKGH